MVSTNIILLSKACSTIIWQKSVPTFHGFTKNSQCVWSDFLVFHFLIGGGMLRHAMGRHSAIWWIFLA